MIDRGLEAIGVDPLQWRALVRTALRVDMRVGGAVMQTGRRAGRGARTFIGLLVSYGAMGALFGMLLFLAPSAFFSSTLLFTFIIFSIGSSLLVEFHAIVLSPDDYRMFAYQPISSRTFFVARLTSVLLYVWSMALALGLGGLIASLFAHWGSPLATLALLAGLFMSATITALWSIGVYVLLLHYVAATHLRRMLSYLQLGLTFLMYGSYFALPRLLGERNILDQTFPSDGWILLTPGAWFASYVQIALGQALPAHVALALGTVALLLAGVRLTAGRVSLDYADRLATLMTAPSGTTSGPMKPSRERLLGFWFREGERRALALVVRGLFRHDMKFRLGVLGILPLTVIYLLGGSSRSHGVMDPFAQHATSEPQLFYFAVLVFPSMLKQALSRSDAYRASWIFYSSPVEPARLVFALNEFVVAYFLLPYLLLLGLLLTFFVANWVHLAILLLVLALLTHVNMLLEVCVSPQLPFTQPATRGSRGRNLVVMIIVVSFVGTLMPMMLRVAFATPLRVWLTVIGLAALNALLLALARWRVHRHVAVAEVIL